MEEPKINYEIKKDIQPDTTDTKMVVTATFDAGLVSALNKIAACQILERIVYETAKRWVDEHYLDVAGKIQVETIVNGAIGKLVSDALKGMGK